MTHIIEALYEKGVFIPIEKLELPERSKVTLKIEKIQSLDNLKLQSYIRLLREGEDAEEIFEF